MGRIWHNSSAQILIYRTKIVFLPATEKSVISQNRQFPNKYELELSYKEATDDFDKYENVLNSLREQWCAAANTENDKALADPETGLGATIGKIMTTIARMCAGDKVPYTDEKKVMEYDDKMYARAKQAQMIMASMKKKQKEYDSLWDKEGGEYDPEGVADNTEAQGELPDIPSSDGDSTDTGEAVSDSE